VDVLHGLTFADAARAATEPAGQLAVIDGDFGRDVRPTYPSSTTGRTSSPRPRRRRRGSRRPHLWLGQNSFAPSTYGGGEARRDVLLANWRQSADELMFVIGDVDAKVVIWQDRRSAPRRCAHAPGLVALPGRARRRRRRS
jgi:hypothetical protein